VSQGIAFCRGLAKQVGFVRITMAHSAFQRYSDYRKGMVA